MRFFCRPLRVLIVASAICIAGFSFSAAHAQLGNPFSNTPSFGLLTMSKKNVTLRSKLPPIYNATGKTVGIETKDALLSVAIEKQLTQSDSSIRVSASNPDLLIECAVSQSSPVRETRVTNSNGSEQHWQGTLSVIFRISAPRARQVVKSDIAEAKIDQVISQTTNNNGSTSAGPIKIPPIFKTKPTGPTTSAVKGEYTTLPEAQNGLVNEVARRVASYLVNTEQTTTVPLAVGGALNAPNKLADGGLWSRYLENLELLTPYPDPKIDAFRLYNIGVANEALAYAAQDNKSAVKELQEASNNYGKAFDARPQDKPIIEAQTRIKSALQYYADIGKTTPLGKAAPLETSLGAGDAAPAAAAGALTNKDVEDMVEAHMDEANILDNIQNARDVDFDISVPAQISLQKAGVSPKILMAMKERTRGTAAPPKRR